MRERVQKTTVKVTHCCASWVFQMILDKQTLSALIELNVHREARKRCSSTVFHMV